MRRLAAVIACTLVAAAPAGAHPGHGAESVRIDGDAFRYSPSTVKVGVGETVFWFWEGTVARNHSVTADAGQAESFDSDPGGPPTNDTHPTGDSFSHTFTHEGRFTYFCRNHATMKGVVEVVPLTGGGTRPRLSDLRVTAGRTTKAVFRSSTRADVVGRIAERRGGAWRQVETLVRDADRGKNRIRLPGDLDPGSYRLSLTAYDDANRRSNVARDRFAVEDSHGRRMRIP